MTRRRLFANTGRTLAATTVAPAVAGCGRGAEAPAAPVQEAVVLEYWSQRSPTDRLGNGVKAALDDYVARHAGRVTLTLGEGGAALNMQKIKAALAGATQPHLYGGLYQVPAADLFAIGALLDINGELKSNKDWGKTKAELIPSSYDGCTWKGKLTMMPMMLAQQVLGINKQLAVKAGAPLPAPGFTWAQFLDWGRRVAAPPEVALFPFNYSWSALNSWMYANGQVPLSADRTKVQYDTPQMLETVQWLHDQVTAGFGRNGAAEFDQGKSVTESVNEAAAMQPPRFPNLDPGDGSGIHVTHFPFGPSNTRRATITYANNYGLVAFRVPDSKKMAAAADVAGWGGRADVQTKIAEASGHPPSNLTAAKPENLPKRIKDNVILNQINEFGKVAYLTPNFPRWIEAMGLLQENLKRVAAGDLRPKDALADAQPKIQQIVTEDLQRG